MKKNILAILIIILLVIIASIIFFVNKNIKNQENTQNSPPNENTSPANSGINNQDTAPQNYQSGSSNTGIGGSGGGGSSGGSTSASGTIDSSLPSDIYTQECGFYFSNYGICAGYCPEGTCVSEGRSCYCKKA